jgi:hypothetical protein
MSNGVPECERNRSLTLIACRDAAIDGQMGQERFDFRFAHVVGVNPSTRAAIVKRQ